VVGARLGDSERCAALCRVVVRLLHGLVFPLEGVLFFFMSSNRWCWARFG